MNKKQIIRLTEGDLHRIVKESVQRILNEADPRSWAAVANRYDQTDPQKAAYARQRAAQQWNNQYGVNNSSTNNVYGDDIYNTQGSNMSVNDDGNFAINQHSTDIRTKRNGKIKNSQEQNIYNPLTQTGTLTQRGSNGTKFNPNGNGVWQDTQNGKDLYMYHGNPNSTIGKRVADQMAQGNGVYDKNRGGWQ